MKKEVESSKNKTNFFEEDGLSITRPTTQDLLFIKTGIDYFKFRFLNLKGLEDEFLKELMNCLLVPMDLVTEEHGKAQFNLFYTFDEDISVYGGREREKDEYGNDTYFFEMKGHALRMFEQRCRNNNIDIKLGYLKLLLCVYNYIPKKEIIFKRIDVFKDDFSNMITKEEYSYKINKGFFTSSFKSYNKRDEKRFLGNEENKKSWELRIGGYTGTHIKLYDKKLERLNRGEKVPYEHWLRVEGRFKDEKADTAFYKLLNAFLGNKSLDETISLMLGELVQLKEDTTYDKNHMYMVKNWIKWEEFLGKRNQYSNGEIESLKIENDKIINEDYNALKTLEWVRFTCYRGVTLSYLMNMENFDSFLADMLKDGYDNIRKKDIAKINYYRISKNLKPLTKKDIEKYIDNKVRYLKNNPGNIYQNAKNFFGDDVDVIYN